MKKDNYEIMQSFTLKNIPDLDTCVLGALELFSSEKLPEVNITYKRPLVVGSGNAEATGRIIFQDKDAVFASESNFEEKLKNVRGIDGVVLISASGGKHAPIIAKISKKYKKKITLITNNPETKIRRIVDKIYVLLKQREPYTYNTSTYLGMILGKTKEDPKKIYRFLKERIDLIKYPNFKKFRKFYLIVPPEFSEVKRMLQVKFIELFGREIARDVETFEYVRHATTVVPSKDELFITFGNEQNKTWGRNRIQIPLPKNVNYASMVAVGYYVIGKIQKAQPDWFKKNISDYTRKVSKIFGSKISPIVE